MICQTLKFLLVVSQSSFSSQWLHFVLALADTHFTGHADLLSSTTLLLALARASVVYHIPSGASTRFGRLLEGVSTGGWCASKLGRGPEYPGLDESAECASWSVLHWISSLD
jgi:hypothetical protein